MAIWATLAGTAVGMVLGGPLGALAGAAAGRIVDYGVDRLGSPERRQVAFTIAAIALAGKMARADGYASLAEFATFQRLFQVPDSERANAERFFRLAQQSTAGFEAYAEQAARLLGPGSPVLEDLLEALLLIATVDGVHPDELAFLDAVAARLGFGPSDYARIKARYVTPSPDDPWTVLGLPPGSPRAEVRAAYRALAQRYHPDRHIAGGTPLEFIRVAEDRMAAINAAYRELMRAAA